MIVKIIREVYDFDGSSWLRRATLEELGKVPETRYTVRDLLTVSEITELDFRDYLKENVNR